MPPFANVMIRSRLRAARLPVRAGVSPAAMTLVFLTLLLGLLAGGRAQAAAAPNRGPEISLHKWNERELRSLPDGQRIIDRELKRQGEYNRRWRVIHDLVGPQHISRLAQERLAAQGLGPALVAGGSERRDLSKAMQADVLRVLLVRVGFAANRDSHLTTIAPGGDFMLDPLADPGPLEIDPPPHDKAYFEAHLAGLSEYYDFMSGGRLKIESTVLPEGDNDSYKLSDVADYGPGAGGFWSLEGLETLVRDMVTTVDEGLVADGGNGLADYDDETPFTYVIFVHAGSDWQSDINGDSPNDIPTFFVVLGEAVDLIGTNPQGNPGKLSECSIIPETTNQDDFQGSIAAAFYHEFGHALGLPDVYDTSTGLPSVGIWDLMDSGTNLPVTLGTEVVDGPDTTIVIVTATGVLPPSLSVWCKWYLGWVEMGEISNPVADSGDYVLPAVGVPRDHYQRYNNGNLGDFNPAYPQAYRAGTSPREYYLLENRWVPLNVAETPYTDLRLERDEATGVIQYLAGNFRGTWQNSGLYDFFMPAGGLLVWHVNADRIASELPTNTINAYGDGLKLVEADGIQDIGVLEAYVLGWFGSWRDLYGGYDADGFASGFNDLYTAQPPSSRNYDRSFSGVRLSEIGSTGGSSLASMKFRATLDPVLPGFPWEVAPIDSVAAAASGGLAGPRVIPPLSVTPLETDVQPILLFADGPDTSWTGSDFPAALYGVGADGSAAWPAVAGLPAGAFQGLGAPLAGAPVASPVSGSATDLFWCTTAGMVGQTHLAAGTPPVATWTTAVTENLATGPLLLAWSATESRLLLTVEPDSLYLLDTAGAPLGAPVVVTAGGGSLGKLQPVLLPAGDSGPDQVAILADDGWFLVRQSGAGLVPQPTFVFYPRNRTGAAFWHAVMPLAADLVRLTVFDDEGELGAWDVTQDGLVTARDADRTFDGPLVCQPAVADLDGDGRHDLVLATGTRLFAIKDDGIALRGFPVRFADLYPLPDSTRIQGPLVVADGTGDGVNEVYFNTTGGHLVGLGATGRLLPDLPRRWGDWSPAGFAVGGEGSDRVFWQVSSGGTRTGYLERIPINGRVTAYAMLATPAGTVRTSEWLGVAGGGRRRGPTGAARDLGSNAPVSAETDQAYLYPNPLGGDDVTVRFYAGGSSGAEVTIYNLEGELVKRQQAATQADAINEIVVSLPGAVSGLYLVRLVYEGVGGREVRTMTLAIEK